MLKAKCTKRVLYSVLQIMCYWWRFGCTKSCKITMSLRSCCFYRSCCCHCCCWSCTVLLFSPLALLFCPCFVNLYKLKILLQVSASWTCLSWRKTRKRYLYSVHYQKLRHAEKHLAQWSTRSLELQAVVGPLAPASIGENTWLVSPGWSVAAKLVNPRILRTVRCYCMQWYAVESRTDHLEGFEGSRHRKPALSWKLLKMLLDNDFHAKHFRLYPGHICIHIQNIEYTIIYLLKIVAIDQNQSW